MTLHGVKILWIDDYYDGPLAGVAEYQDRLHYFDAEWDPHQDSEWTSPRLLRLWSLTDEEIAAAQARHQEFEQLVSTMWCLHLPAEERTVRPSGDGWAAFYQSGKEARAPYSGRQPVGEFDGRSA